METRYAEMKTLRDYKSYEVSAEDDQNDKDRISNLPNEIVHHIFSFLPLEHVAKTCVLSKCWKYLWYSYPCLDFSTVFVSSFGRDRVISAHRNQYKRINEVLRSLEKHWDVRILILKFCGSPNGSTIVRSMHAAAKLNIQEFDFEFFTYDSIDLPHSIISSLSLSLRYLRLEARRTASLRLPPLDATKNCFKSLQSLILSGVDFCDHPLLPSLFTDSLFPSLAKLHLDSCWGLAYFRIQMSGLKDLCLERCNIRELDISMEKLEKLTVEDLMYNYSSRVAIDAPLLEFIFWSNCVAEEFAIGQCDSLKEAVVHFFHSFGGEDLSDLQMRGFSNFLNGISQCRSLTIDTSVFEILLICSDRLGGGVQWSVFSRLTSLEVIPSDDYDSQWNDDDVDWESHAESLNLFLRHLKVVKINGFDAWSDVAGVGLVRLLLNNGKVLEQLLLLVEHEDLSPLSEDTKSEIMEFPRASSNVDIIFQ